MSRVINTDSVGRQRTQLVKSIVLALREMAQRTDTGGETRDLVAFIAVALQSISEGIDSSVAAWEKRGYWVKADKFRMEWDWAGATAQKLRRALASDDWGTIAKLAAQVGEKLGKVQIATNNRLGRPWTGAYQKMLANDRGQA